MKHIFFTIVWLLMPAACLMAQTDCGTEMTPEARIWFDSWDGSRQNYARAIQTVQYVPVHLHLVGDDNGNGYLPKSDAYALICELNKHFAPMDIIFFLEGPITNIDSTVYYSHSFPYGNQMINLYNVANVCNIYVVDFAAGTCGYAFYPQSGPGQGKGAVVLKKSCSGPGNYTLAHEMGHYFSLPHTFQDWNTPNAEFVNGSNCATKGDKFCDTPADCKDSRWFCPYTGNQTDPNGAPYAPDGTLFMSYSREPCANRFSPMQQSAVIYSRTFDRPYLSNTPVPSFNPLDSVHLSWPLNNAPSVPSSNALFTWNAVPGATEYNLRIKQATNGNFVNPAFNLFTADTFLVVNNLLPTTNYQWKVLPINLSQTCLPADSGNAAVRAFSVVFVSGLVSSEKFRNSLTTYPNPVGDAGAIIAAIYSATPEVGVLEIYGPTGQRLFSKPVQILSGSNQLEVPVHYLSSGLYTLVLRTEKQIATSRFVK